MSGGPAGVAKTSRPDARPPLMAMSRPHLVYATLSQPHLVTDGLKRLRVHTPAPTTAAAAQVAEGLASAPAPRHHRRHGPATGLAEAWAEATKGLVQVLVVPGGGEGRAVAGGEGTGATSGNSVPALAPRYCAAACDEAANKSPPAPAAKGGAHPRSYCSSEGSSTTGGGSSFCGVRRCEVVAREARAAVDKVTKTRTRGGSGVKAAAHALGRESAQRQRER